ncbi:hypothetical protein [Bradyrhizobium diazoefficiens]|uniref:hypothetical protein n=1 Tax=Bradyrhizobium diazoefficiens TaxID=1355477 RepID=UPI000577629F|nr:hypothetical protein [Bradyrhizobium diazoefficiens]
MKALVTILGFMGGAIVAGLGMVTLGVLAFGDGPYRGPTWFVYASVGAVLGIGWGGAEWARNRFTASGLSQKKTISSIIGIAILMCGAMAAGKFAGKWAAGFDPNLKDISQSDRHDIIKLVKQQCENEAPRKVAFKGARASRVVVFCQCFGDAVGSILSRADADFMIQNVSMPTSLDKRVQDLGVECLKQSGVL